MFGVSTAVDRPSELYQVFNAELCTTDIPAPQSVSYMKHHTTPREELKSSKNKNNK